MKKPSGITFGLLRLLSCAGTVISCLTACSAPQAYQAIQANRYNNQCAGLPKGAYEDCASKLTTPYDQYRLERDAEVRR